MKLRSRSKLGRDRQSRKLDVLTECSKSRELTKEEKRLIRWMLERAPRASKYLHQLELARALLRRCPCGCASIDFLIDKEAESSPMREIVHFGFSTPDSIGGIFVFEMGGILAGLEVYAFEGDAPRILPPPESLRELN